MKKEDFSIIGTRVPKLDAGLKVTGKANYGADTYLPGMLYGKVLRSNVPHAKIKSIDYSEALKLPGVMAVCDQHDFPEDAKYGFSAATRDQCPIAIDKVRFVGDEVCAVAATELDIAEAALDLIKVEYEELPAVFDPMEAMKEDAPIIQTAERNICSEYHNEIGNVEEAFAECDFVREGTYSTQGVKHGVIEPNGCVGVWDIAKNKATIYTNAQSPYVNYRKLAMGIGMRPPSNLRVVQTFVGAGFGSLRSDPHALDFCALMLSKKCNGRPVKIVCTMDDILMMGEQRHPFHMDVKMGMMKDGTLKALQCNVIADGGAYSAIGPISIALPAFFADLPFHIPNYKYDAVRVFTNKSFAGSMRGHGTLQIKWAVGNLLDEICNEAGLDVAEVCLKNGIKTGDVTARGWKINSSGIHECIEKAVEASGWKEKRHKLPKYRGIGMGVSSMYTGVKISGHNSSTVVLRLTEDGTVAIQNGATDIGQGSTTVIAIIVAEALGLRMEDIMTNFGVDTDITPADPGTYGSRVTFHTGNAALRAAEDLKRQLSEFAGNMWGVSPDKIGFKDRQVFVEGDPEKSWNIGKMARQMEMKSGAEGKSIYGVGSYDTDFAYMDFHTGKGEATPAYGFSCDVVEVEVDPDTGKITILNVTGGHDCGKVLNRTTCEGQVEGAWSMLQGQGLFENIVKSKEDGRVLNNSFMDYKMCTAMDIPKNRKHFLIESNDPEGPYGAKEIGEGAAVAMLHALGNAVYDAVGVRIRDLPITAEKVLKAIKEKEQAEAGN